jgi:hypothetical protein
MGSNFRAATTPLANHSPQIAISPEIFISLATPGVILAALAGKIAARSLESLGLLSEDLLRGDRLPVIELSSPGEKRGHQPIQ